MGLASSCGLSSGSAVELWMLANCGHFCFKARIWPTINGYEEPWSTSVVGFAL